MTTTPARTIHDPDEHTRIEDDGVAYCGWAGDGGIYHGCGVLWTPGHDVTVATNRTLHTLSAWIDAGNAGRDPEAITWGRLAKVSEECGEVIAAYIGATGQNPRKGTTASLADVREELLDVAVTALGAIAHLHGNDPDTADILYMLQEKIARVVHRAGVAL